MSTPVQFVHDHNINTPEQIGAYLHCSKCLAERPPDQTPREWSRLQIGWTTHGFQVVCTRHDCNVTNTIVRVNPDHTDGVRQCLGKAAEALAEVKGINEHIVEASEWIGGAMDCLAPLELTKPARTHADELREALLPFAVFASSLLNGKRRQVPTEGVWTGLDCGEPSEACITIEHLRAAADLCGITLNA